MHQRGDYLYLVAKLTFKVFFGGKWEERKIASRDSEKISVINVIFIGHHSELCVHFLENFILWCNVVEQK